MVLIHHLRPEVIEIVRKLIVEDEKLRAYMDIYNAEIDKSLEMETADDATIKSHVTYVNKLPTREAKGTYLSLQFGSRTIRLMIMTVTGNKYDLQIQTLDIPEKHMVGKSEKLLDYIAKSLSNFVDIFNVKGQRIPLGVTFGFPMEQINLQDCKLLEWSKDFDCKDLLGQNIFTKLKNSFRKYPNLKTVYIIGILNETVSMILAASLEEPDVKIAVDIGSQINSCYMEKISRVKKYEPKSYAEKVMCICLNTDGFGEDGCLDQFKTDFDVQLDQESSKPGKLTFEKMTSGAYIGEIARLALVRCIQSKAILRGLLTEEILKKNSFQYSHMLRIESDSVKDHKNCFEVLDEFGYSDVSDEDCIQVQFVCRCVSRRTANLMAAQLAVLINRINEPTVTVVLQGEMVTDYPRFEWYMLKKLNQLKKENFSVHITKLGETGTVRAGGMLASTFGEEVMNRDEKLRRLPGFPVNRCHFRKTGRCLNPNCSVKHPCDTSKVNPMQNPILAEAQDIEPDCFDQKNCPKKNDCLGYDQL